MVLAEALRAVCDDLEKHEPNAPSLHFARGVLAAAPTSRALRRGSGPKPYSGKLVERAAEICRAYEEGASLAEVAQKFGGQVPTVRRVLVDNGVQIRPRGQGHGNQRKSQLQTSAHLPTIVQMRSNGATLEEIGCALGITRERVRQIIVKSGLKEDLGERPFRPDEIAAMEEYRNGRSLEYVAAQLGLADTTARKWLVRYGIPIRPARKKLKAKEERERLARQIADRYLAGESTRDIARAFGFAKPEQIYRHLAIAGVKPVRLETGFRARQEAA